MAISKTKEKITVDSKNKISIITNIEVNINQNNILVKSPNTNNIINLNINNQRPTTMKKPAPTPFLLPVNQVSNYVSNSANLVLSTNPMTIKPNELNIRNLQSGNIINDNKIVIRDINKKRDAETQTEEIFFKM